MLFCHEGCTAAVDTGSSFITGPASAVSVLMKDIGATLLEERDVSKSSFPSKSIPLAKEVSITRSQASNLA